MQIKAKDKAQKYNKYLKRILLKEIFWLYDKKVVLKSIQN